MRGSDKVVIFLQYALIFISGCIVGWVLELLFNRIFNKKWINPGFLVGPWLPIYGFGVVAMTLIYSSLSDNLEPWLIVLIMTTSMTLLELICGIIFKKFFGVRLWDYSMYWGNIKGYICPVFTMLWLIASILYYFVISKPIISMTSWLTSHITFSFVIGLLYGILAIDVVYSTRIIIRIKQYAIDNQILVKYEELKLNIRELSEKYKKKYSFFFPFKNFDILIKKTESFATTLFNKLFIKKVKKEIKK
jgi:uncharacterized membrane protein